MLEGAVAIVTGGAKGLGKTISQHLIQKDVHVIVFDKDQEALNQIPFACTKYCIDITDESAVQTTIESVYKEIGEVNILVNNAGVIYSSPLINIMNKEKFVHDYQTFKKVLDINLNAVFLVSSFVAAKMVMNRTKGVIINISSICSKGNAGQSAYSAAKAGVNALTKTWAKELGPLGIRVVAVSPGFIETESTISSLSPGIIDSIKKRIPLRSFGDSQAVAKLVISAIENNYINGAILNVDGGCSL